MGDVKYLTAIGLTPPSYRNHKTSYINLFDSLYFGNRMPYDTSVAYFMGRGPILLGLDHLKTIDKKKPEGQGNPRANWEMMLSVCGWAIEHLP
jgi:hypothetical protein